MVEEWGGGRGEGGGGGERGEGGGGVNVSLAPRGLVVLLLHVNDS